jgi:hypothetical protein
MNNSKLSIETLRRIDILFSPDEKEQVSSLLIEHLTSGNEDERFQFAVLKYSKGDMQRLQKAIEITKLDFRDMLLMSGFWNPNAQKKWMPKPKGQKKWWWPFG